MKKHPILTVILVAYSLVLIRLLVFKNVNLRIGPIRIRIAPNEMERSNFIPFKTIARYLHGDPSATIAAVNLLGNIALFAPIGFLVPIAYPRMNWRKALMLALSSGLLVECWQVAFRVGVFDVDDVILNGLGVMVGHGVLAAFTKRRR